MLLDYVSPERERPEEGVRVAGLMSLAEMVARGLLKVDPADAKAAARTLEGRDELWNQSRVFVDPMKRLTYDSGVTYEGKPLPTAQSLRGMMEGGEGQSIREYLDGTQLGDMLAQDPLASAHMDNTRLSVTGLPGSFEAGYTPASMFKSGDSYRIVQPGFIAINANSDAARHAGYFEHELQHMLQNIFGHSRGTNLDEMSGPRIDFLTQTGRLDPQRVSELDEFAKQNKTSLDYNRYLHAFGEAEARAAERATQHRALQALRPGADRYTWTSDGTRVNAGLLFDVPEYDDADFSKWWKKQWSGN